ncbi:hypothetical protein AVEN_190062-1 [Araneus ventricosus]|uniref:Uncharacterized protein n=1 Tax=Araneus ventricosus TaxID=182803 RepID=A0A4Y2MRB7_ARAVE|nr:hypothetical protein AVEN_190062-1 [Araneus ventricosus]
MHYWASLIATGRCQDVVCLWTTGLRCSRHYLLVVVDVAVAWLIVVDVGLLLWTLYRTWSLWTSHDCWSCGRRVWTAGRCGRRVWPAGRCRCHCKTACLVSLWLTSCIRFGRWCFRVRTSWLSVMLLFLGTVLCRRS